MKLRHWLISMAMMSLSFISAEAITPPVPSPLINEDKILGAAYYDTLGILSTPNECSDFFGGPSPSVEIFNGLIGRLRKDYLSSSIGIRMSGAIVNMFNASTKHQYRLFNKVSVNANGPFYRKKASHTETSVPGIGSFEANTKEVRVLMFLHELGHAAKGKDGGWLLPDDGRDEGLSRDNTKKIEDVCGDQIRNLGKGDIANNSASGKHVDEKRDEQPSVAAPLGTPLGANAKQ